MKLLEKISTGRGLILYILAIIVFSFGAAFLLLNCERQKPEIPPAGVLQKTKHPDGTETAKVKALELENKELKEQNARLATLAKTKGTKLAAIVKTETAGQAKTDNVKTEVKPDKTVTYSGFIADRWLNAYVYADKDGIQLDYKIFNEFEITQQTTKKGTVVAIKNLNPNTTVTSQEAWVPAPKVKRFGLGVHIGYGISAAGIGPVVSGGLNFNLVRF